MSAQTPATEKTSAVETARQKTAAPAPAPATKAAAKKANGTKPAVTKTPPTPKAQGVTKAAPAKQAAPANKAAPIAKATPAANKVPEKAMPQTSKKAAASAPAAKKAKPAPASPAPRPAVEEKTAKIKLVRDSFTIPENEYAAIGEIKKACLALGVDVKRTEVIRAGLLALQQMPIEAIADYIGKQLPKPKTGRPKKAK